MTFRGTKLSGGLWFAFTVAAAIGALADSVRLAVAIGIFVTLVVAYVFLSRVPDASSEILDRFEECLSGVPNWWPFFFPH